jgi:hypothetical protein
MMEARAITHGCREFLRYRGFITEGELDFYPPTRLGPSVLSIQKIVAKHFGVPLWTMRSDLRFREYARPRQVAMFFAREFTNRSLPEIGRLFGGRDHTTVIHALRKIGELFDNDPDTHHDVLVLRAAIRELPPMFCAERQSLKNLSEMEGD